jgi:16S rRNA (uracil1498-N3)-methyltransferase
MADPRFYVSDLAGPLVHLEDQEARHASQSRRLKAGDPIVLFDGLGHEATGLIAGVARSTVEVQVSESRLRPRPKPTLTLAVAVPKGARQDVLIEKCTELGVAELRPIVAARSVSSASDHRLDKWRRATIEAAKQSGQCWLPLLRPLAPLEEVVNDLAQFECALVAAPGGAILQAWGADLSRVTSILAFIGPEGGWTEAELANLVAAGCKPISLGPNILRMETAAIAISALVHALAVKR